MPYADLGTRRLHYERRGSGAPLLLIQGMAGHRWMWGEAFLAALATHFDVVTFDHRGIGDCTEVPGQFTVADLAENAVGLLDALDWTDAHVMGISLGGMVAQELALVHPERVRALVLGCTYAGGSGSTLAAPGPLRMLEAMNTGDRALAIRTAYEMTCRPGSAPTTRASNRSGPPASRCRGRGSSRTGSALAIAGGQERAKFPCAELVG